MRRSPKKGVLLLVPFLAYWSFTFLYYHAGLQILPNLEPKTYLYLLSAILALILPVIILSREKRYTQVLGAKRWSDTPLVDGALIYSSCVGHIALLVDKLISGVGLTTVFRETEFLRDEFQTSLLTTVATPFCGCLFPSIAILLQKLSRGVQIPRHQVWAFLIGIVALLLSVVLSGNRALFLQVIYWGAFLYWYTLHGAPSTEANRAMARSLVKVGIIFGAFTIVYFVFISSYRVSEEYLSSFARKAEVRGELGLHIENPRVKDGLILLSAYLTQQYRYIDALVSTGESFYWEPSALYNWYLRQAGRIGIGNYIEVVENLRTRLYRLGLDEHGWPSLFGHAILCFGVLGSLVFFALLGLVFGLAIRRHQRTGAAHWLLAVFVLYGVFNYSYMSIPNDHNFALSIVFFGILKIRENLGVSR